MPVGVDEEGELVFVESASSCVYAAHSHTQRLAEILARVVAGDIPPESHDAPEVLDELREIAADFERWKVVDPDL